MRVFKQPLTHTTHFICLSVVVYEHRECEAALGKDTVTEALSSLDLLDPENDPVSYRYCSSSFHVVYVSTQDMQLLLPLLGDQAHNMYAPKLRQLWLCEDALEDV